LRQGRRTRKRQAAGPKKKSGSAGRRAFADPADRSPGGLQVPVAALAARHR